MPKTRQEKRKRTEEGFAKEFENVRVYLCDLQDELAETLLIVADMKPMTPNQEKEQMKQLLLLERVLRELIDCQT